MKLLLIFAGLFVASVHSQLPTGGSIWAVLVAGSNTYTNYRHQADICHAYQVLHAHGIPDSNIITMMFDDIAENLKNPIRGEIINNPLGPDVYNGVLKDYTGLDVTPQNFINILLGNETEMKGIGSGKVLKSGPEDNVFINFVGFGETGLVAFPTDILYVDDWINTLISMNQSQLYGQLTVYMEASEAGSMFNGLPNNINIYATTAANETQPSYACYYVDIMATFLGDVYSVSWMENSDVTNITAETLIHQFDIVVDRTDRSDPKQYGDLTIGDEIVGYFQGLTQPPAQKSQGNMSLPTEAVSTYEVPLEVLKKKLMAAVNAKEKEQIKSKIAILLANRQALTLKVRDIVYESVHNSSQVDEIMAAHQDLPTSAIPCYKDVVSYFSNNCYNLGQNYYAMMLINVFNNMCQMEVSPAEMKSAIDKVCYGLPEFSGVN